MKRVSLLVAIALPAVAALLGMGCIVVTHHVSESVEKHVAGTFSLAFSPDGSRLASGGRFDDLKLWECSPFERRFGLRQPSVTLGPRSASDVRARRASGEDVCLFDCLAFSTEGARVLAANVLAASAWRTCRLFDVTGVNPRVIWEIDGHDRIQWAVFPGESDVIVLASDLGARVVDARTGAVIRALPKARGPLALARDGRRVVAVTGEGELAWIDPATGALEIHALVEPPVYGILSITLLDNDTRCLVTGFRSLHLHDLATGRLLRSLESEIHFPRAIGSPDGRLAILLEEGDPMGMGPTHGARSEVLEISTGKTRPFPTTMSRGERVLAAAFAPDGLTFAIGTDSGRVACADVETLR
jgi:WD40 repeat protein